jgi:hypothetical protein
MSGPDVGDLRQGHAAQPGDAGAEAEGHGVDAAGRHADAAGHGRFCVTARTNRPSRVLFISAQTRASTKSAKPTMTMRLTAARLRAELDAARHPHRVGDFHVLRAEDHARRLDQDQRQAPGGEQGFQRRP